MKKSPIKSDAISETTDTAPGSHETPAPDSVSTPANIVPEEKIEWEGNPDYFQTGKKAGQLKPRARSGATVEASKPVSGLDFEALKATAPNSPDATPAPAPIDKKKLKEEKKIVEAKIASKLVMRALDLVTSWISGGTFGADFTEQQTKARNKYRDELETDWQDYLMTLDIPMHPALVCILGSVFYVAPAIETKAGKERVQSFKEKGVSKLAVGFLRRASK